MQKQLVLSTENIGNDNDSMVIYMAIVNGKMYIGQTTQEFKKRKKAHIRDSFNESRADYDTTFHEAIREYGVESVEWRIVHKAETVEELNMLERVYIEWLDTYTAHGKGYNDRDGGHNKVASDKTRKKQSEAKKGARHPRSKNIVIYNLETKEKDVVACGPEGSVLLMEKYGHKISTRGCNNKVNQEKLERKVLQDKPILIIYEHEFNKLNEKELSKLKNAVWY